MWITRKDVFANRSLLRAHNLAREEQMKKLLRSLMLVAFVVPMAFLLTACNGSGQFELNPDTKPTSPEGSTPAVVPDTAKSGRFVCEYVLVGGITRFYMEDMRAHPDRVSQFADEIRKYAGEQLAIDGAWVGLFAADDIAAVLDSVMAASFYLDTKNNELLLRVNTADFPFAGLPKVDLFLVFSIKITGTQIELVETEASTTQRTKMGTWSPTPDESGNKAEAVKNPYLKIEIKNGNLWFTVDEAAFGCEVSVIFKAVA
jgi:predicted small lipoprotein YifL